MSTMKSARIQDHFTELTDPLFPSDLPIDQRGSDCRMPQLFAVLTISLPLPSSAG